MIPYDEARTGKNNHMRAGRIEDLSIRSLMDTEEGNILPTDYESRFKRVDGQQS